MRAQGVIIQPPLLDDLLGFSENREQMRIQALVAKAPVETFDEAIVCRFTRADKVQPDPVLMRPAIKRLARKLRPVIHPDNGPGIALEGAVLLTFWRHAFR